MGNPPKPPEPSNQGPRPPGRFAQGATPWNPQ